MSGASPVPGVSAGMYHYLGELYRLGATDRIVAPTDLAEALDVSPPAVARMVERMQQEGLVERVPYKGVQLLKQGERAALRSLRFHRLSEAFLVSVMGYGWHEAHDMADALAEAADEAFIARMEAVAGHPTRCPHGEPIPTAEGVMPVVSDSSLLELGEGFRGRISRVKVREAGRLIYLADLGCVPGTEISIVSRAPFEGPVRLRVGDREQVIGADLAGQIRAEAIA